MIAIRIQNIETIIDLIWPPMAKWFSIRCFWYALYISQPNILANNKNNQIEIADCCSNCNTKYHHWWSHCFCYLRCEFLEIYSEWSPISVDSISIIRQRLDMGLYKVVIGLLIKLQVAGVFIVFMIWIILWKRIYCCREYLSYQHVKYKLGKFAEF